MLSNAEKQKRYRNRALKGLDGFTCQRLQVILSPEAALNLQRLSKHTRLLNLKKRDIIEKAINDLAERLDCNHDEY